MIPPHTVLLKKSELGNRSGFQGSSRRPSHAECILPPCEPTSTRRSFIRTRSEIRNRPTNITKNHCHQFIFWVESNGLGVVGNGAIVIARIYVGLSSTHNPTYATGRPVACRQRRWGFNCIFCFQRPNANVLIAASIRGRFAMKNASPESDMADTLYKVNPWIKW